MLCLTRECRDRALAALATKSNLPQDRIYFSATHTHSGPGGYSSELVARAFLGAPCAASRDRIVNAIAESVYEATRPLLLETGLSSPHVNFYRADYPKRVRNRLLHSDGPVDAAFVEMDFSEEDAGALSRMAILCSFGAHATTRGASNTEASADYPGELQA